jgi:hypothetical protein
MDPPTEPSRSLDEALAALHGECRWDLAGPGDWLTGAQRVAVWAEARDWRTNALDLARLGAITPAAVGGSHPGTDLLPAAAVEVAHRVASDPGRLTRSWAATAIGELGEETYTEVVGVVAIAEVLDHHAVAMGREPAPLPEPRPGEPARHRPEGVGDVGAWVSQARDKSIANVSRALSLVPVTNGTWRRLVNAHYSRGEEFFRWDWQRSLSRPQVELTAGRVTALLQCFY